MVGSVLGNRYEILEQIGKGGMARVYKARCKLLNRFVAVKVLRNEFIEDEEFITRFNIESQAAASLSHSNVVSIYDVGQEEDIHYIVMEYIEGITLKELINKEGALRWKEAVSYSIQICSALEHAHKKNIIHRDIKPHNIMLTKEGVIKVTDFGIARAATTTTVTLGGNTIGSVHYFSPEQARGSYTDEKSDIYSLGIVMYEMLTGKVPFDAESPFAVAMKHIQDKPIDPCEINQSIPVALQSIILKAMNKEQRRRYPSATSMLRDLYKAYDNPYDNFIEDEGFEDSPTQKVPVIAFDQDNNVAPNKKKKMQKEDKVAVIAAILTSIIIIGIIVFAGYGMFNGFVFGNGGGEEAVPNLVGKDFDTIKDFYKDPKKFNIVKDEEEYNDEYDKGKILSQEPEAEIVVKLPATVKVTISKGIKLIKVLDFSNKEYRSAEIELSKTGFKSEIIQQFHNNIPEGIVIRHVPEEGVEAKSGDTIRLYVSKGREIKKVKVPNLIGEPETEALRLIGKSNLVIGETKTEDSDKSKNTVIEQGIAADTEVEEKSVIDITISNGKQQEAKKEYIDIYLPQDKETVKVMVTANNNVIYNKSHNKDDGPIKVEVPGKGEILISVYFDGELKEKDKINIE